MKNILLMLLFVSSVAWAQSTDTKSDSLYMVTYTMGSLWDSSKSPGEQQFFKEHSGFMGKLRKDGITKLGARYADKGMIIISASSLKDAHEIILAD